MSRRKVTLDYESLAIRPRPHFPPRPVGVAIHEDDTSRYMAWGHPTGNNCTYDEARSVLLSYFEDESVDLIFFNSKFDIAVATEGMGLPMPNWKRIHDPMFLLFLADPYANTFALKPSAERYLGLAPSERDAVRDWLVERGIVRKNDKKWGAHIADAPGDLVGEYAIGDVVRTRALFDLLYQHIVDAGMEAAYDTERELMPILLRNEQEGLRVDVDALVSDLSHYEGQLVSADQWLRTRLNAPEMNVDSDEEVANALDREGIVTEWVLTDTGRRSVSKANLKPEMFHDQQVAQVLGYRNRLATCLGTFMRNWADVAPSTGRIYTSWNQIRSEFGGAATGRMSSTPNFQNIPKVFKEAAPEFAGLSALPKLRKYILPEEGHVWLKRDYMGQELRVLAHFEDGEMLSSYLSNPKWDLHQFVIDAVKNLFGFDIDRGQAKIFNFGLLYGQGIKALAERMGVDVSTAQRIRQAQRHALPGLAELDRSIKQRVNSGGAVRTWGGRLYGAEPAREINGVMRTFDYKVLNYLIQGSSADCTKRAIINYDQLKQYGRFLCAIHDEASVSAPKDCAVSEMKILKQAMDAVAFDVPMLSDGAMGDCWGNITPYKDEE